MPRTRRGTKSSLPGTNEDARHRQCQSSTDAGWGTVFQPNGRPRAWSQKCLDVRRAAERQATEKRGPWFNSSEIELALISPSTPSTGRLIRNLLTFRRRLIGNYGPGWRGLQVMHQRSEQWAPGDKVPTDSLPTPKRRHSELTQCCLLTILGRPVCSKHLSWVVEVALRSPAMSPVAGRLYRACR